MPLIVSYERVVLILDCECRRGDKVATQGRFSSHMLDYHRLESGLVLN